MGFGFSLARIVCCTSFGMGIMIDVVLDAAFCCWLGGFLII